MATNPPAGDGHRNGAVRKRSQVYNHKWLKDFNDLLFNELLAYSKFF